MNAAATPRVSSGSADVGQTFRRARYAMAQGARVAWYAAHYVLAYRLTKPMERGRKPTLNLQTQAGDPKRIREAFFDLFAQDLANIEAGLYPAPAEAGVSTTLSGLANSARFLADLPRVQERRLNKEGVEVREQARNLRLPTYYLQNFHYQSGGWLTEESAKLYDTQVEVLFTGAADAMRRIALGSLARALRGVDQRTARVLDLACGNGRFLTQILGAFPRINAVGLDLSPAYADEARSRLAPWPQAEIVNAAAEATPFPDAHFDAVTTVYLFHELPPRVRRDVAREIARVLKPGGAFIFADSIQTGDAADLDQMLEFFPATFHEPYFTSYQREDLAALFGEVGLSLEDERPAFLTKALTFRKG